EHAIHHASSSNLDKRGVGDIWVMTVEEYSQGSTWKRIAYRFYRNPFVMFGLGPLYLILISNRFNDKKVKKKERFNTYIVNIRSEHSIHHASSSNLDKLGVGDICVMTVEEYSLCSTWKRIAYRFYRNPFVMFGLGPLYLILISNRFNDKKVKKKERFNTYIVNI